MRGKDRLEVVFSDSEKGAVAAAKNTWDVVTFGFFLDVGALNGAPDGPARRAVFQKLWGRFGFDERETEAFFEGQRTDLQKLHAAARSGMRIRIWTSSAPYSACGLHAVCAWHMDTDCDLRVVTLPPYWQSAEDEMVFCSHWGEVAPNALHQFIPRERPVSSAEKRMLGSRWRELIMENAPLRATVNGRLLSVSEDFYDSFILQNIPDGEFYMASLIGTVLGKYRLGVSDSWLAARIDQMIEDRRLIAVDSADASHPYDKRLRKTHG